MKNMDAIGLNEFAWSAAVTTVAGVVAKYDARTADMIIRGRIGSHMRTAADEQAPSETRRAAETFAAAYLTAFGY